jgi:predicted ester cyclase
MGPNSRLYLSLIDELFHRGNGAAVTDHVTSSYRSHDPFFDVTVIKNRRGLAELALRELRGVRYEVCDVFEQADRVAARWVLLGHRQNGTRVAVPGISMARAVGDRIDEGWSLADYHDVADLTKPAPLPTDAWDGEPRSVAPAAPADAKSRLAAYAWLIEQSYHQRRPEAMLQALHPEYVGFDPFRDRGTGVAGILAFTEKVIALYKQLRYNILDAVEAGDRLCVRYRVEGVDATGRRVVVPGISINHFEGARIRRGWTMNHYGAMSGVTS